MIYLLEHEDKDNRAAAHDLLRRGLREEYGITGKPAFTVGAYGKPYLTETPGIFFNISHCRVGAACAVSPREVGIDMQDVRPVPANVARRVCTEAELAALAAANDPDRLFCKLWAVKEAYVKLRGGSMLKGVVDTDAVIGEAFLREGANWFLCCFGCDEMSAGTECPG
ncbi:MAG: 4'-phosphopantetheinyl transferase superfamily protein [Oscillospiraceae bacterium]|jgi:4'-phosphopantetheinyl transferase|nr:4'-phosphopantetheinyl transferase superfamily protein [Oscillospiraceae bacterium]